MLGIIDEACVMNYALEAEEIKEIMDGLKVYLAVDFHNKLASTWGTIKMYH